MAQHLHSSSMAKGTQASLDEFKYGFPTAGLAVVSHKWWGSSSSDSNEEMCRKKGVEDLREEKLKTVRLVDDGAEILLNDKEKPASGNYDSNMNLHGTGLLSHVRKSAAEDGRKALRLGVYRGYGVNTLPRREMNLVRRIFNSSLPSHWR
ncbi:hypothetical protein Vadar_012769 [Vaccinium darrowii]|uniref:Uncharacterized protein n=1 Tax=Vaccinium darrowii TaxID=229202 RepID=A0ACB7X0J1_9ERIC|nr:hypothetical protein Vadar_012769 [Vaccinium darrowii]